MNFAIGEPHHVLHCHVYYQNDAAVFSIDPIDLVAGNLPRRQQRLFEAWAELDQKELLTNWALLQSGQVPAPIEPLEGKKP